MQTCKQHGMTRDVIATANRPKDWNLGLEGSMVQEAHLIVMALLGKAWWFYYIAWHLIQTTFLKRQEEKKLVYPYQGHSPPATMSSLNDELPPIWQEGYMAEGTACHFTKLVCSFIHTRAYNKALSMHKLAQLHFQESLWRIYFGTSCNIYVLVSLFYTFPIIRVWDQMQSALFALCYLESLYANTRSTSPLPKCHSSYPRWCITEEPFKMKTELKIVELTND